MSRATKALVAGVGVAGAAAAALARRSRPGVSGGAGEQVPGAAVVTVTILRPVDEVTRAWAAESEAGAPTVRVDFGAAPGDRGTEVRARIGPASLAGDGGDGRDDGDPDGDGDGGDDRGDGGGDGLVARVRGETPVQQQRDRLRRFKAMLEGGEVVATEGQPSGRGPVQEAVTRAVSRRLRAWGGQ